MAKTDNYAYVQYTPLVEAAPDLLGACCGLLGLLERITERLSEPESDMFWYLDEEIVAEAQEAIEKATA